MFGLFTLLSSAQNITYSPYSRFGLGELASPVFAHNAGMAGANIAYRPDSMMPVFINPANPAAIAFVRMTSLEVGGNYVYSKYTSSSSSLKKWGTNFTYATVGFPVMKRGGACFGIMPYSNVGYDLKSTTSIATIGDVEYRYSGSGGINKVYLGYGFSPFNERLVRFKRKNLYVPDSVRTLYGAKYKLAQGASKLLNDLSLGFTVNYLFGSIDQQSRVVYSNSTLYNNTVRQRTMTMKDVTANFGIQTAITIDSAKAKSGQGRRALKEKVKIVFGAYMNLNNPLRVTYDLAGYNYILNGFGQEVLRDTIVYNSDVKSTVHLPLEQGVGVAIKKGERINIVLDAALTDWTKFVYLDQKESYANNLRLAGGVNWVPEKYAAGQGAFWRRSNYRFGLSYNSGFIQQNNGDLISSYAVNAGIGLPVGIGRLTSMVHISGQYGFTGPLTGTGTRENFWRVNFGFTFSDRWFQKFRYD